MFHGMKRVVLYTIVFRREGLAGRHCEFKTWIEEAPLLPKKKKQKGTNGIELFHTSEYEYAR